MGRSQTEHELTAGREIPAPAAVVYDLLADYHEGHPSILPRPPFGDWRVESGGRGAGTVVSFSMRLLGVTRHTTGHVSEPEPGRVLAEHYPADGLLTRFVVEPRGDAACHLTIQTVLPALGGWRGRWRDSLYRRLLLPVYERELDLIAAAAGRAVDGGSR